MPRGTGLALARERMETERDTPEVGSPAIEAEPVAAPKPARGRPNAGKLHIGGYYEHDDPVIQAFRRLAFETGQSQQELIREALVALLAQKEGEATFAPSRSR